MKREAFSFKQTRYQRLTAGLVGRKMPTYTHCRGWVISTIPGWFEVTADNAQRFAFEALLDDVSRFKELVLMRGRSRSRRDAQKNHPRAKTKKPYFYAVCTDDHGKERRVRVQPSGDTFYLMNDRGHTHLAHPSRRCTTGDVRLEIGVVYQYRVVRFEYPYLEHMRKMEALRLGTSR
jgi:hypothetical protein